MFFFGVSLYTYVPAKRTSRLLLGSALIFRALVEIDAPTRPPSTLRLRRRLIESEPEIRLPKAA
jgi:hypothetical protein